MWCNINLMIIATVCVPLINSTAVIHYLDKAYECGEQLTLKCVITGVSCCSNFTRIWRKNSDMILNGGVQTIISTKYSETINKYEDYFTLNINSLQKEDFGVYVCAYGGFKSAAISLNINDFYCFPCWDCASFCCLWAFCGSIGGAVLVLFTYVFAYFCYTCDRCCKLPFFGKRDMCSSADFYTFEGKDYPKGKVLKAFGVAIPLFLIVRWLEMVLIPSYLIGLSCSICYYNIAEIVGVFGLHMFTFIPFYAMTLQYINGEKETGTYCCELFINWFFFIPSLVISLAFFCVWSKKPSDTPYEIHIKEEEDNAESQL